MAQSPREDSRGLLSGISKSAEFSSTYMAQHDPRKSLTKAFEDVCYSVAQLIKTTSPARVQSLLLRAGFALLPSFVQSRIRPSSQKSAELHPTAWLDGLRGIAALFVFFCHLCNSSHNIVFGYGQGLPGDNRWLIQLPIIRLIYSGPPMVAIFFVVSGYALSYKPLKQMRSGQFEALMTTMSSSVFRRTMRLYLPCMASTLIVFLLVRIGAFEWTRDFSTNPKYLTDVRTFHPFRTDTLMEQWTDWRLKFWDFIHPWSWGLFDGTISYDWHLWTIPTEFRSSFVLFLTLVGTARMIPWMRVSLMFGLTYWILSWNRWEMILFYGGSIIAELNMMFPPTRPNNNSSSSGTLITPHKNGLPTTSHQKQDHLGSVRRFNPWTCFWIVNLVLALFIMSSPDAYADQTPGYRWLSTFIPEHYTEKYRFLQSVGAIYLVWIISNCVQLQAPLMSPPIHYLGKISFSLYLVHGMVTQIFGYLLFEYTWKTIGNEPRWRKEVGFCFASFFIVPAAIWAADVFWRLFDMPSVKFARWIESKCTVSSDR